MTKATTLVVAFFVVSLFSQSVGADVRICNRGDVAVKVLRLKIYQFQKLLEWNVRGWIHIPANECLQISRGNGYTHMVFAVEDPNGTWRVVKYEPAKSTLSDDEKIKEVCVNAQDIEDNDWNSEGKRPAKYLPPCREGFTPVPTSATALIMGNARLWLDITPRSDDWKRGKSMAAPK